MAVNNSLVAKQNQRLGITAYLTNDAVKNQINQVIGGKDGTKFISAVVSAVNNNPALQECTNQSILSAALLGQSLNLSPSPQLGQYYMVPFNDKNKGKVAQFQLGYKGYIQLAIRSGQYKKLNVLAIKEGELIRFDPLNEEIEVKLIDDEEAREQAATIMPCLNIPTDSRKQCIGQRKRCLHMLINSAKHFLKMVEQSKQRMEKRRRFPLQTLKQENMIPLMHGCIPHFGIRILTEWHTKPCLDS